MKFFAFNSLRGRYAIVTAFVTVVVVCIAFLSFVKLQDARHTTADNIANRNQLLEHSRLIRDAVWETRESLATFLLEPNNPDKQKKIGLFLHKAKDQSDLLLKHPWIFRHRQEAGIENLKRTLITLEQAINKLIETRLNVVQQYPALAIARENMLPNYREFNTSATLALNEYHDGAEEDKNYAGHQAFMQARHIWTRMVSNFRMYLANRLGSFNEKALSIQEQDIALQYESLKKTLVDLQKMDDSMELGIQGSASLETLISESSSWFNTFQEVKRIHGSNKWRTDTILIQENIEPLMESVWQHLITLDKDIEQSTIDDLSVLTSLAQKQGRNLWLFTVLSVLLIVVGFFALERTVLNPIASISSALKNEAEGGLHKTNLPVTGVTETLNLVSAFKSMHKQVQARQVALEYHALHDSLTNLGNRNRLIEHMELAIKHANRNQGTLSLLMLDLNQFKEVNDTLGHPIGDQLLIEVGNRLAELLRETDTIARLGGDEFAILLPTAHDSQAKKVAEKIAIALKMPFTIEEQQLYTNASIGITAYPQHGLDAKTLIQHADTAMYLAKRSKTGWALYDPGQDMHSIDRLGLMADLRYALKENKLELCYQPKCSINSEEVQGVEALLRWNHPEHGHIPPEEIIALAEQTGLIHDISLWILQHAIEQANQWRIKGLDLNVAVNLSAHNLQEDTILKYTRKVLAETGFPSRNLTLEITEDAMMANPERAIVLLGHLNAMGVKLAVDDFGTGFSSLGYLKQLPVHELKIDKSFVTEMLSNDSDAIIVRSTIDLAHNLGMDVVAEGVEDHETWDLLKILRCDTVQGYVISKPIAAREVSSWVKSYNSQIKLAQRPTKRSTS